MSNKISVENCLIRYENREIPIVSGEFHYWRVLRENWEAILERIAEMGLKTIATYVPWNYHELEPGHYDFTGETSSQRDLAGFMDLVRDAGMYLVMRPGPYIYSEWEFGGVPERAAKKHRLDPQFLEWSRDYIEHVCDVLVPRQITRGGNVVMVQADNEPYPPIESFGTEMGCFDQPGVFKNWIREKYDGDIAALNARWRTQYSDFDQACVYFHEPYVNTAAVMGERILPGEVYGNRYADTHEFIGWYATKIVATVGGWLRECGIDVPIYANGWSPLYQDFNQFMDAVDLAGTDIYPLPFFKSETGDCDNWLYNLDIVKQHEADVVNGNVWSAEYQSGLYPIQQVGYLEPQHFRMVGLALMARGLKGWNWYMLVNRDNWYHCPINEWGRTNEFFPVHRDLVRMSDAVQPWHTRELHDVDLLVYKPHRVADPGNFEKVYQALEAADIDYGYWNPVSENPPNADTMIYTGAEWLDPTSAGRLAEWVKAGGTLLLFSRFPTTDDTGKPLELLPLIPPDGVRPVGLPVTIRFMNGSIDLSGVGHMGAKTNLFFYNSSPGIPITATLSTQSKEQLVDIGVVDASSFVIGYATPFGQGRIVHIGAAPCAPIVRMILEQIDRPPHAHCSTPEITTTLHRHRDGHHILFAINRSDKATNAAVALDHNRIGLNNNGTVRITNLADSTPREISGEELTNLEIHIPAHDVTVLRLDA